VLQTIGANSKLMTIMGLDKQRHEVTGKDGGPIEVATAYGRS
jgi:hypothetical protein